MADEYMSKVLQGMGAPNPMASYDAQVLASMQPPPAPAPAPPPPAPPPPPGPMSTEPPLSDWRPATKSYDPTVDDYVKTHGALQSLEPSAPGGPPSPGAPNVNAPAGPAGPPAPEAPAYQLASNGGVIAAHEVERRGPTLLRAQNAANQATANTIESVQQRSEQAAQHEYMVARVQEAAAHGREDAAMQSAAERQQELEARQADVDGTVKQLSQMRMDPDRFWASRTTGQKIAGMVGIALGGFLQGARGGSNPGLDIINQAIDRDIKAQEFSYTATRDTANMKQTAFSLAMQKYGQIDAARAVARASALDAVQAQFAQAAAINKGTEVGNRADMAFAQLQADKANQISQGIAYIPQTYAGRMYRGPGGLMYTEAEMKGIMKEQRVQENDLQKGAQTIGGQLLVAGAKNEADAKDKSRELAVQLPNGDVIRAPNGVEAGKLRDLSAAVHDANQLVARAKEIRSDATWRVDPRKRAEMDNIQAQLTTAFKDAKGLGALSGPDMDLARAGTADLFAYSGVDSALDSFRGRTEAGLRNRVKAIPDAPDTAQGKMPASFTPHGGK